MFNGLVHVLPGNRICKTQCTCFYYCPSCSIQKKIIRIFHIFTHFSHILWMLMFSYVRITIFTSKWFLSSYVLVVKARIELIINSFLSNYLICGMKRVQIGACKQVRNDSKGERHALQQGQNDAVLYTTVRNSSTSSSS